MTVDHWMRFSTFAEQRYFEYPQRGTYAGVLINANMVCYAPAGLAGFLLEKTAGTPYLVDPLTHAFQHNPEAVTNDEGRPKSSVQSLADVYGEPVASRVGQTPLLPSHLDNGDVLEGFVHRCIEFQRKSLADAIDKSDATKYLGEEELAAQRRPCAVVAPYFYMTESTIDDWLPVNRRAAAMAVGMREVGDRIFAAIVIGQGVLAEPGLRGRVVESLVDLGLDGFLLWIDNLDEQSASRQELTSLIELGRALRARTAREVINLHGGYFSILAAGNLGGGALTGVVHGPEFGEYRSVVPVGGGIPIARYYVPELHVRVRYRDALRMIRAAGWLRSAAAFHSNVCDCSECQDVLRGDPARFVLFGESTSRSVQRPHGIVRIDYPKKDTKERCLRHYLQRKHREYVASASAPGEALAGDLRSGAGKFQDIVGPDRVAHLRNWRAVFERMSIDR